MEPNETPHHHHQQQHPHHTHTHPLSSYFSATAAGAGASPSLSPVATAHSPSNGLMPPANAASDASGGGAHMVFPHSVGPSSAAVTTVPVEPARRKRGRPRKYGTPEQALAAKKTASSSSAPSKEKRYNASSSSSFSGSSKKSQQLMSLGNAGQSFTPHVISVAAGEDVGQKLMSFLQQSKREMCILSASGAISNASLRQPATSGGNVTYEGRFEIISLSGSYIRTGLGGRTGGLSVCLSSTEGQIIGGGVGGPLKAAGPVQVIVGTFVFDNKKDVDGGTRGDASAGKLPPPVGGASLSSVGFRSPVDSSGRVRGTDDHQTIGGNPFLMQSLGMHVAPTRPTDWRGGPDTGLTGRTGHGAHQSPENGDYEQLPD